MNKIFITLDMDWACNEVMDFLYDLLEEYEISVTLNITNDFPSLEKFINNNRYELGIHPNFNSLVDGHGGENNKENIISQCKKIVPNAVVARSHSLLNSTPITKTLYDYGIKFELNYFIVPYKGICISPWSFEGVLQVPFFYEDDLYLLEKYNNSPQFYLSNNIKMHRVFNFHPIHLFLNSESLERYYKIKENYHNYAILKENVNTEHYGTLDFFRELIELGKKKGYAFETITKIKEEK